MLSLSLTLRIFLATDPADMRKDFEGLSQLVRDRIAQDPLSGHLYIFRNRGLDRITVLYWDCDGFALWYKRLEKGTCLRPPTFLIPSRTISPAGTMPRVIASSLLLQMSDKSQQVDVI